MKSNNTIYRIRMPERDAISDYKMFTDVVGAVNRDGFYTTYFENEGSGCFTVHFKIENCKNGNTVMLKMDGYRNLYIYNLTDDIKDVVVERIFGIVNDQIAGLYKKISMYENISFALGVGTILMLSIMVFMIAKSVGIGYIVAALILGLLFWYGMFFVNNNCIKKLEMITNKDYDYKKN